MNLQSDGRSPLRVLVQHDSAAAVSLLEQCARDPPFAGPLGKQNRLRVARALLACESDLQVRICQDFLLQYYFENTISFV